MGVLRETIETLVHDCYASVAKPARSLKIPRWQVEDKRPLVGKGQARKHAKSAHCRCIIFSHDNC